MAQIITAQRAAALIQDGWTITTGGFGSCGHPEAITAALEERFQQTGLPTRLSLIFSAGQGDKAQRGINRLAKPGLLRRVIGGYWALAPRLGELAEQNAIEAHNWPQGVISQLFRAIASGSPGIVSRTGIGTFIDPRQDGGRLSTACTEDLIRVVDIGTEEYLLYPSLPIHCAVIRGTRADPRGNISMEREASFQDALAQAMAAHNSGGIVIAQVERLSRTPIPAQEVRVPGVLVDYVVPAPPELHWQTYGHRYNPTFVGDTAAASRALSRPERLHMGAKKIIARRAFMELLYSGGSIVNLGIGTPEAIAAVAGEEGGSGFTLTVESGAIGGYPAGGMSFGATVAPEAMIDQPSLFDLYDGGGIDIAFLGCGQVDAIGNVNVSRFGGRIFGVGGFVNISQAARRIVFCGTFTAGDLAITADEGRLHILREGRIRKFVERVEHLSFNAQRSAQAGQEVLYVTERAVLRLDQGQLTLCEVAPGIDPERDVIAQADADIRIADDLQLMDERIFQPGAMGVCRDFGRSLSYFPAAMRIQ